MRYTILFLLFLFTLGCEMEKMTPESSIFQSETSTNRSSIIQDSGPETPNPDNPEELCIRCGCQRDYQNCKNTTCSSSSYGPHACCTPEGIDTDCCKEDRNLCHKCNDGFICFRWSFMEYQQLTPSQQTAVDNGKIYFTLNELTTNQIQLASDVYYDVISKWQNGTTLNETDYEILDMNLNEF